MTAPSETQRQRRDPDIVGLLLAGGQGSRFEAAGGGDKLLAPWHGEPIAAHAARLLVAACDQVLAVLPPGKPARAKVLAREGCKLVEQESVREGMGRSIAIGLASILSCWEPRALVVMLADMPAVQATTLRALLDTWLARPDAPCVLARHRGQRGHPVVFGRSAFEGLLLLKGDRGAARLVDTLDPIVIDVEDPGILRDIDTPADLLQLEELQHGPKTEQ